MSADEVIALPLAFSGQRLDWRDLPRHVRTKITELAGAQVTAEISATSGFSPGFAAVLELADGRGVFVKAVSSEQNATAPELARAEIRVAAVLPSQLSAPRLLWSSDDGEWVLLGFEVAHGRSPEVPWRPETLEAVLAAVATVATAPLAEGHGLPRLADLLADEFTGWHKLAALDAEQRERLASLGGRLGTWATDRLDDLLTWEAESTRVLAGDALVHGDLRSDNVLVDPDERRVWLIDWPHAGVGAPWLDLAFMLPSVALQGGGDPAELFAAQPTAAGVAEADLRAGLTGLAGYFAWSSQQPAPRGIPNLRSFQAAQAVATLRWLRDLA